MRLIVKGNFTNLKKKIYGKIKIDVLKLVMTYDSKVFMNMYLSSLIDNFQLENHSLTHVSSTIEWLSSRTQLSQCPVVYKYQIW